MGNLDPPHINFGEDTIQPITESSVQFSGFLLSRVWGGHQIVGYFYSEVPFRVLGSFVFLVETLDQLAGSEAGYCFMHWL